MAIVFGKAPNQLPTIDTVSGLEETDGSLVWNPNSVTSPKLQLVTWSLLIEWLAEYFVEPEDFESTSSVTVDYSDGKIRFYAGTPGIPTFAVTNLAALKALGIGTTNQAVAVLGYYSANDGGGGLFVWDSTDRSSTATGYIRPDDGIIVAPNVDPTGASGCWIRQIIGNEINVRWYGARGNNVDSDTVFVQKAIYYACNNSVYKTVYFPAGDYYMHSLYFSGTNGNVVASQSNPQAIAVPYYYMVLTVNYITLTVCGFGVTIRGDCPTKCKLNFNGVGLAFPGTSHVYKAARGVGFAVYGTVTFEGLTVTGQTTNDPAYTNPNLYCNASSSPYNDCWDLTHKGMITFANFPASTPVAGGSEHYVKIVNCRVVGWRGENIYGGLQNTTLDRKVLEVRDCIIGESHGSMISGEWRCTVHDTEFYNFQNTNAYESTTDLDVYFHNCNFKTGKTGINNVGIITTTLEADEHCPITITGCTFQDLEYGVSISRQLTADITTPRLSFISGNTFIDCNNAVGTFFGANSMTIVSNDFVCDRMNLGSQIFATSGNLNALTVQGNTFRRTEYAIDNSFNFGSGNAAVIRPQLDSVNSFCIISNNIIATAVPRTVQFTITNGKVLVKGNVFQPETNTVAVEDTSVTYTPIRSRQSITTTSGSVRDVFAIDNTKCLHGSEITFFTVKGANTKTFKTGNSTYYVAADRVLGTGGLFSITFVYDSFISKWVETIWY